MLSMLRRNIKKTSPKILTYALIAATLSLIIAVGVDALNGELTYKGRGSSKVQIITIATPVFFIFLLLLKFTFLGTLLAVSFASLNNIGKPSRRARLHTIHLKRALFRYNRKSYADAYLYFSKADALKTLTPSNKHLKEIAKRRAAGKENSN
ncbi:hypothetical protein H3221_022665 [Pseudomonas sp. LMG 31766]|uniref:Uncharacterized protein n=1 Tax=Pseudomonas chaetocerotis TaxID=2758695 RepID=A0A931D6A9_9PSED|nr:hypothetical protein [Pseudomonas chaetocerotis]MBZ9667549.1 hypothetical protein [Pseudomonas chaetocerotis]